MEVLLIAVSLLVLTGFAALLGAQSPRLATMLGAGGALAACAPGRLDLPDRNASGSGVPVSRFRAARPGAAGRQLRFHADRAGARVRVERADLWAGPGRLRREGGLRAVPRLAARGTSGRAFACVRADVGRDDQDGT